VLIGVLSIGREAFNAVLSKPVLRIKPLFRSLWFETRAGQDR
jgi:hypothetical protein